ncbi:MAG TPA: zinc ribbon domain-containing protein [Anaeromyxobacter sp.]
MPIYEYECPKCGRFDALQKMSDPALKTHDVCGSKVRKLMSASAFAFKGSGFYITDYNGRNSAAITGRAEPKPAGKPEAKAEPKKDAKPKAEACASCPANKSAA